MQYEYWQPYLIAGAIGLLVGIEREKAHPSGATMGVRTFLLVSLLGAVAGGLENPWLSLMVAAFCFGLIAISYFTVTYRRTSEENRGLTTEFAGGLVFCLGLVAHTNPMLAALLGPVMAVVLVSKAPLHRFTKLLRPAEIESALLLLLLAVAVLNLVEDRVIDAWGVFNPRKFGFLILILASLEFSGYVLTKLLGEKSGALLTGFFGGLVSSTAVLLSSARAAVHEKMAWRRLLGATIAATVASLGQLLFIVGLVSRPLLFEVAAPVSAAIATGLVGLFFVVLKTPAHTSKMDLESPLDWKGVFRLALLLGAILAVVALVKRALGEKATLIVSTLTAMFELHGVSLANSTMFARGQLNLDTAVSSILFACAASLVAKLVMSWMVTRGAFSRALSLVYLSMGAALWLSTFIF